MTRWPASRTSTLFIKGYNSAVDWPSAAFWKELADYYPDAKIILSSRSAESWYGSISETILAAVWAPENWPPQAAEWFTMVSKVLERSFGGCKDEGRADRGLPRA
jgi:hypothetical protein